MARLRDSRSPSPGRHRKDDDRRNAHSSRDYRRRSRTRSPIDRRYRDRDARDSRRGDNRRRDRSIDRRDNDHYRGCDRRDRRDRDRNRDRRSSRDRLDTRDRNRDCDRDNDRDRDRNRNRDKSPSRNRDDRRPVRDGSPPRHKDNAATPSNQSRVGSSAPETKTTAVAPQQSEADKKAERLTRLEAWKKKKEQSREAEAPASQARKILADMDSKSTRSPSAAPSTVTLGQSPTPEATTPAYSGKFDPKVIAKKSAPARASPLTFGNMGKKLGGLAPGNGPGNLPPKPQAQASTLPANRGISGFGFGKVADAKGPSKRKIDLDEEETSQRKLTKLPSLPLESDDTPWADQDDEEDDDDEAFGGTEEEAIAAARAAHEKRMLEKAAAESEAMPVDIAVPTAVEAMEVDEEEIDPLDAFMANLASDKPVAQKSFHSKSVPEPEAYYSDEDATYNEIEPDKTAAPVRRKKTKDIPTIDYSKLNLNPVRKNFWVEPVELSLLTEDETADLRLELDGIKVNGKDVPKPVQKWAQCGLTRQTLDTIDALGFDKPTPIQMQALPVIMSGRDVVGVAKTGSGKTIAFLLPMFRHIMDQDPLKENDGPISLIMTPTRELAVQIHRDCKAFLKTMNLRSVCAYGGAPISEQIAELRRGAEIVVCTPGRMIDLLAANQGRVTNLRRVSYVVLDEADRMFDMGFEPQVMKIFANMRPDKQTILFSATMPRLIDSLTKKVLKNPVEIKVGGQSVVAPEITQIVEIRDDKSKFIRVLELLGELYEEDEDARTLIFVDRQEKADDLLKELMIKGYPCMSIHGGKDQVDRDSTISDFKKGIVPILIATSIAARGLDVKQLKLVINFDAPNHLEDYVHRAGRTGRAGKTGTAVTFVTEDQENCAAAIAKALEISGQPVPERLNEMRKAHREKVKSGKAKDTSGFGGKGLSRLDQEREAARMRERKTHKADDDDDNVDEEKKEKKEKILSAGSAASAIISRDAAKAAAAATSEDNGKTDNNSAGGAGKAASASGGAPSAVGGKGGKNPLDRVTSAISAINSRLGKAGQLRTGQPIDNKGPDAGAFHATLEINDFPQKARWAVTNRTNVAKILEATATSITTKGSFYPLGKEPGAGQDPKLYILIEGDTEMSVRSALVEMERLLEEGTKAAEDAASRAPVSGRFTVT
ncbi:Pre-mRNA-processing ATP-dependent RNA helicase PRP5 [Ceratocystis platani]|uniref:RNA helicase n=1 Tax=Ceratocystis fimbriata f. sp. platani TaxID=88771 RepID=A0A0F8B059_CERFI|nr:Pre-mRNA-processing ATP-dependent RNA helicase PRP5 [Ceratocystis platani]